MSSQSLSKSKYLRGLQCHKSLWLQKDGKIKPTPVSKSSQIIFDEGTRVGEEAQKLFPGGKLIKYEGSTFDEKIAKTKEWLASGESTIYEATFKFDNILVMVDILTKGKNGWEIYEVKSAAKVYKNKSNKVQDVYINDVAIQYYVLKGSGLDISKVFLVHINNQYVRQGPLDIKKLFSDIRRILKHDGIFISVEPHYIFWLLPWLGTKKNPFTILSEYNKKRNGVTATISQLIQSYSKGGFTVNWMEELIPDKSFIKIDSRAYHFAKEFPLWQLFELKKRT